jgi:hypothetical protein
MAAHLHVEKTPDRTLLRVAEILQILLGMASPHLPSVHAKVLADQALKAPPLVVCQVCCRVPRRQRGQPAQLAARPAGASRRTQHKRLRRLLLWLPWSRLHFAWLAFIPPLPLVCLDQACLLASSLAEAVVWFVRV